MFIPDLNFSIRNQGVKKAPNPVTSIFVHIFDLKMGPVILPRTANPDPYSLEVPDFDLYRIQETSDLNPSVINFESSKKYFVTHCRLLLQSAILALIKA